MLFAVSSPSAAVNDFIVDSSPAQESISVRSDYVGLFSSIAKNEGEDDAEALARACIQRSADSRRRPLTEDLVDSIEPSLPTPDDPAIWAVHVKVRI